MELILINERKLKVMLSNDDMIRYDLCGFEERIPGEDINTCFGEMLRDVRARIGFCADSERLCMQYYPCRDGGCELYITKIDNDDAKCGSSFSPKGNVAMKNAKSNATADNNIPGELRVTFERINDMINACRTIADSTSEIPDASAFVLQNASCEPQLIFPKTPPERILMLLTEFGTPAVIDTQSNDILKDKRYIEIAAGNAIEALSAF